MKNLFILAGALIEIQTETLKAITKKLSNPAYITVALALREEIMEALVTSGVKARICEYETAAMEAGKAAEKFGKMLTKGIKGKGEEAPSVTVVAYE